MAPAVAPLLRLAGLAIQPLFDARPCCLIHYPVYHAMCWEMYAVPFALAPLGSWQFCWASHTIPLLKCTYNPVLRTASFGPTYLLQPLVSRPRYPCQCINDSYVGWGPHGTNTVHHVRPVVRWGHHRILAIALAAQAFSGGMGLWKTFSPSPLCLLCSNKGGSRKQLLSPALSRGTQKVDPIPPWSSHGVNSMPLVRMAYQPHKR